MKMATRSGLCILTWLLALGCARDRVPEDALSELPARERAAGAAAATRAAPAIVVVLGAGAASGVIVHPRGLVLTARHALARQEPRARVRLSDGRGAEAQVLMENRQQDLALLLIDGFEPLPSLALGVGAPLGAWVLALGRGPGGVLRARGGRLEATLRRLPPSLMGIVHEGQAIAVQGAQLHSAPLVPGDSGGALIDLEGRLLGLQLAGAPALGRGVATRPEPLFAALAEIARSPERIALARLGLLECLERSEPFTNPEDEVAALLESFPRAVAGVAARRARDRLRAGEPPRVVLQELWRRLIAEGF